MRLKDMIHSPDKKPILILDDPMNCTSRYCNNPIFTQGLCDGHELLRQDDYWQTLLMLWGAKDPGWWHHVEAIEYAVLSSTKISRSLLGEVEVRLPVFTELAPTLRRR